MSRQEEDFRRGRPDSDFVLAPSDFAYIQDGTKGHISVYVGPYKTTISQTDIPVKWDPATRTYKKCDQEQARCQFPNAPEGFYMVLQNPVQSEKDEHPVKATSSAYVDLQIGRKINIPGPATFPLWPGQSAEVIEGHRLRSNQYLLVRVYNDEEAQRNWDKAVMKPQKRTDTGGTGGGDEKNSETQTNVTADAPKPGAIAAATPDRLTMGQLIIVQGTDVSFYIPPTGVEVVPDESGKFVRDAVTLERLEYCILLDESGEKSYRKGPDVVFPSPTETFVTDPEDTTSKRRKFRAIDLNEIQGIYVKVIADYEENGQMFKAGEELFITGKQQAIYYPRPEHSIIRYGTQTKHYAVAVTAGEALYVLDRMAGSVGLVQGPKMYLPDPRKEVIARRMLTKDEVDLWFPGNTEASRINEMLRQQAQSQGSEFLAFHQEEETLERSLTAKVSSRSMDTFQRGTTFTEPRTITPDNKYRGSVRIEVWPGFAVLVVSKTGKRRIVIGPTTTHLEYDETLLPMSLSTGKPKTTDTLYRTVYLKVRNNTVSDIISAETKDLCRVNVKLSYRVNFTGDQPEKWFEVDNYVKFLTDHLRSLLRHAIKQRGIEEFYQLATTIIRDTVLGISDEEKKERPGRHFNENEMHVYDVEILDVKIEDATISDLLVKAQQAEIKNDLEIVALERSRTLVVRTEEINREKLDATEQTVAHRRDIELQAIKDQLGIDKEKLFNRLNLAAEEAEKRRELEDVELHAKLDRQEQLGEISVAELARGKAKLDQEFADFKQRLEAQTAAIKEQIGSISDKLADGLVMASHAQLATQLSKDMAPLLAIGGGNVEDMFKGLVQGTFLQNVLSEGRMRKLTTA